MNCPYCSAKFKFLSGSTGDVIPRREIPCVCENCSEVSMFDGRNNRIRRAHADDIRRLMGSPTWTRIENARRTFQIQRIAAQC